ncbi:hypothetical protein FB451DRAFT_1456187, partial [Mycena latifolia]
IADRKDHLKTGVHLLHTSWQENLAPLALKDTSPVTFELRYRPAWWKTGSVQLAATTSYPLSELLEMQGSVKSAALPLYTAQTAAEPSVPMGALTVHVHALSSLEAAKLSLDSAQNSVREFNKRSKTLSRKQAARYSAGYDALRPICGILDIVGPLIAFSPEPICAAVVGVVRGAAKSVKEQIEQDADVLALMETIKRIFDMVVDTVPLHEYMKNKDNPILEAALTDLVTALGDCTQFMSSFCKSTFLGRVARTPEKAKELEGLQYRLTKSREDLHRAVLLEMIKSNERSVCMTNEIATTQALAHLHCVSMLSPNLRQCTDGAHTAPLAHVTAWATSPLSNGKNVFWLRGPADCGKSAVAVSLLDAIRDAKQLGGYFFFEEKQTRDPSLILQTFAAQLAERDPTGPRALAIAGRIRADPRVVLTWLELQFAQLLLEPLQAHPPAQPLVFILGGLEWCG